MLSGNGESNRESAYINVKASPFNAVGDGVEDDTVAIQSAIDFASLFTSGTTIFFPAGIYRTTSQLNIEANYIRLQGPNNIGGVDPSSIVGATILGETSGMGAVVFVNKSATSIYGVTVTQLRIAAESGLATPPDGLSFKDASECAVRDCWIGGNLANGIKVNGADMFRLDRVVISTNTVGIYQTVNGTAVFLGQANVQAIGLNMFQHSEAAVKIDGYIDWTIYRDSFIENTPYGFLFTARSGTDAFMEKFIAEGVYFFNGSATPYMNSRFASFQAPAGAGNYLGAHNFKFSDCKAWCNGATRAIEYLKGTNAHAATAFTRQDFESNTLYGVSVAGIYSDSTLAKGRLSGSQMVRAAYQSGTFKPIVSGFLLEEINVVDFGATGDGTTDDTDAVQAAYDALPEGGGSIYFPHGIWKFNLTVNKYNVRIAGDAFVKASGGGDTNPTCFIPADPTLPLIQVGNDTAVVRGFRLENATLYAGDSAPFGTIGVYFAGGAFENFVTNVAFFRFKTALKFQAGATFPCSKIYIHGFEIQGNHVDTDQKLIHAIMPANQASYTTGIYFSNGEMDGPSTAGSFAIELDGTFINMSNVYADLTDGKGIHLLKTNANVLTPYIRCSNVDFDSGGPTAVLLTLDATLTPNHNLAMWSAWLRGSVETQGRIETDDGTLVPGGEYGQLNFLEEVYNCQVLGELAFYDHTLRTGVGSWGYNNEAKISRSGTSLTLNNSAGDINLIPAGNINSSADFRFANTKGISLSDNVGTFESALAVEADNDLLIQSPTLSGNLAIVNRSALGGISFWTEDGDTMAAQFDADAVAGNTRFLIYDVDTAVVQRVRVGANGTGPGGVGRALYIDNI